MAFELNPKLLDVVSFETLSGERASVRTGTIIEFLGADAGLVEISDESGTPTDFITVPLRDMKVVWSATKTASQGEHTAEQPFQEALLLLQNGMLSAAKERFDKAFAAQPNLAGTLMNMVNDLAQKGSFDSALFLYQMIVELRPDYALARENLARTFLNRGVDYANRGALDKALEDFTKALSYPASDEIISLSRHNLAAALTQIGLRHVKIKRFIEAFQFFLGALQLATFDETRRNFALAVVSVLAWKQDIRTRVPEEESFREPLLMGLTYSECLNAYGATVASLGKTDQGREIIQRALLVDPNNELARKNLGILSDNQMSEMVPVEMWGLTSVEPQVAGLNRR